MKRFSNILFVADSIADDTVAFQHAVTLANNNQGRLTVVGVVREVDKPAPLSGTTAKVLLHANVTKRRESLQAFVDQTDLHGVEVEIKVLVGREFIEIIREVIREQRDLIVKSIHLTGVPGQKPFGTMDMKLLRKCPCPVWLVRPREQQGYREILAAVDYDPEDSQVDTLNGQILEMASALALSEFAELHVVHAWRLAHEDTLRSPRMGLSRTEVDGMIQHEEDRRREWLKKLVKTHCAAHGHEAVDYLNPHIHLVNGIASNVVPALAEDLGAELVVMGTVCRTGILGLLIGNTAEDILNQIHSAVLTVKPAGFVSPVALDA